MVANVVDEVAEDRAATIAMRVGTNDRVDIDVDDARFPEEPVRPPSDGEINVFANAHTLHSPLAGAQTPGEGGSITLENTSASKLATQPPGRTSPIISRTMTSGFGTLTSTRRMCAPSNDARGSPVS